jgi:hypothetical protein
MFITMRDTIGREEIIDDTTAFEILLSADQALLLLDGTVQGLPYCGADRRLLARRRRRGEQRRRRRMVR